MESKNMSSHGLVQGRYGQEYLVCEMRKRIYSQGCSWVGCDPFAYAFPLVLAQILLFSTFFRTISFILKPFKQSTLSCQLLAGIVLGRSYIGKNHSYAGNLFPPGGRLILETIADVGFIFHLLILGINIDVEMLKKIGKDAIAVGITSFMAPFTFGLATIFFLPQLMPSSQISIYSLLFLVTVNSMTSFAGTTSHLSDLRILNSDIGRIATLASLVNDCCNYILYVTICAITTAAKEKKWNVMWSIVWNAALFCVLVFFARPMMIRLARSIPEGQRLKESHFLAIIVPALLCGFLTESMGMPAGFGTFLFGAAVPDGPPLGTSLVDKLDSFCTGLLLPAKFTVASFTVDIFSFRGTSSEFIVGLIILLPYLGKFIGVLISGLFFQIPFWDSLSLSLIMCCRGVVEISVFISLKESGMIADEAFALLIIAMLVITGLARPLVLRLYDPTRRYAGKRTNSILYSNQSHLKILVCIHGENNVAPILNLLAVSNPTRESPISVFILNLMELQGRAAAVLERNVYRGRLNSMLSRSEHIAKAFDYLAKKNQGALALQHFTSVAPYETMHSDICTIALDVQAHIVITPFHKQEKIDGSGQSNSQGIRIVNQNLIKNAPSSVGILIDRSHMAGAFQPIISGSNFLRIFVLFLGGIDDREALAYANRMIGHPKLSLTLVWLRSLDQTSMDDETDNSLDADMIRHFRANTIGNPSVDYSEEVAKDAVGTTRVLRSFEGACDLCIVGRYHPPESPLTQGMITDWSECPELGALGDMLACSDFRFSVLVVKQQDIKETDFWKQNSFASSA